MSRINIQRCVLKNDLEYPKELPLHKDYFFTSKQNRNQKRNVLSTEIADIYSIPTGYFKKLAPNFFDKGKYLFDYKHLQLYLRLGSKLNKIHRVLEFNQSQWLIPFTEFNTKKTIEVEKNVKNGKALCKLINNPLYGKEIEKLRNRINLKLANNEKDHLKYTWKPSYMSHKIFDNDSFAIRKKKLALKLNKPQYIVFWNLVKY